MRKVKMKFKRRMALLLAFALIVGVMPFVPDNAVTVQAADGNTPSVTAFATKDELMTAFTPDENGESSTIGILSFGRNSNGATQEWYILGKDSDVAGDNTVLVANDRIVSGQKFSSDFDNRIYDYDAGTGYGETSGSIEVYANHYGASELRTALKDMAGDTDYFTTTEQGLMNETTVTTKDTKNSVFYTTTDKLYALAAEDSDDVTIKAGSRDQIVLKLKNTYAHWNGGQYFRLRSPYGNSYGSVLGAQPDWNVGGLFVDQESLVCPATNLNLESVIFASGAEAASSQDPVGGGIWSRMTLRLDGSSKTIGTVMYDEAAGLVVAQKDANATGTVSLVVQGNDGSYDWYYSVQAGETTVVTKEQIQTARNISDIDLADCKIWLETTIDDAAYAKMAEEGTIATPTTPPTEAPTAEPTVTPTTPPTEAPTAEPSGTPTTPPTEAPTAEPSGTPTTPPTEAPTAEPSGTPTTPPTETLAAKPTASPTENVATPNPDEPVSPEEATKNLERLDFGASAKWKGNTFMLSWAAVRGAEGYDIFAAKCGKKLNKKSLTKTVKEKKTSASLRKIAGKKISGKKGYKFRIKAWKKVGGKKVYIRKSMIYHVARNKNKKYTNAKKLLPTKRKYALKKGKKVRLKVRIVKQSKKKKLLPHGPELRYRSNNKKVATVTSNGKVIAKGKGTCYIYAIALNGIRVKIRITVK